MTICSIVISTIVTSDDRLPNHQLGLRTMIQPDLLPAAARFHPLPKLSSKSYYSYLHSMAAAVLCLGVTIFTWGMSGECDHFASASLKGSNDWFENYEGLVTRQMQDRDIFITT
jgi:hypothetical protein